MLKDIRYAAAAAALFPQLDGSDGDAPVYSFQHVVQGQRRGAHSDKRLHLHACAVHGRGARGDQVPVGARRKIDVHVRQRHGMTERDEIGGPLRRHDSGDSRGREDVALGRVAVANCFERAAGHGDASARHRATLCRGLGADIDHMRGAGFVEMSRFGCHGL